MAEYKIFKKLDECKNNIIVNIAFSQNGEFLGIKTQNGVIFLKATRVDTPKSEHIIYAPDFADFSIIDSYDEVPSELLKKLEFKIGLIS